MINGDMILWFILLCFAVALIYFLIKFCFEFSREHEPLLPE